jgi:hypothetical protein
LAGNAAVDMKLVIILSANLRLQAKKDFFNTICHEETSNAQVAQEKNAPSPRFHPGTVTGRAPLTSDQIPVPPHAGGFAGN